jgi:hypothetical protein
LGSFTNWAEINAWINLGRWIYVKISTDLLFNVLFYLGRQMLLRCALNRLKAHIELCFNFLNVQGPRVVDLLQDLCDPSRLV